MTCFFIGAGPGAPDLITLRAQRVLARCRTCLYAGSLVPPAVLDHLPADARRIDTQALELDEIVAEIAAAHERGEDVARLHSGDLSVFSALAEQARRLDRLGIPWEIVPGVPAFAAAAATLRRELTVPGLTQAVILARYARNASPVPDGETLERLAEHRSTLVVHLGAHALAEIVARLLPYYGPDCPAAVVADASRPDERVVRAPLAELAARAADAGVRRNAVIFVGRALAAEGFRDSHLYSAARAASLRGE